jgi:hypothetical protein
MTTLSSYLTIADNLSKWQSVTAKTPEVKVATQYFEKNIGNVKTAQQLVNNPRLFNYAMTAFGLSDMSYAKGMMQKVMQQGVTNSHALANTLSNSNMYAFAKAFDFGDKGSSVTSSPTTVTNVVNAYIENSLETSQGQQDPGVQLALYFQNHAPSIKSVYGILSDKSLLTVVQTALGISPLTAAEPVDTQAQMLTSQLHISDFQDPTKLKQFIERFCANYDANNAPTGNAFGTTSAPTTSISPTTTLTTASLFPTQTISNGIIGIGSTTLLNAANARLGLL